MTFHTGQPIPAEATHFQVIYTTHDRPLLWQRSGVTPTTDKAHCLAAAQDMIERHDVKEVFVCTVHAAYQKETIHKRVI